jgi:hypothetical protein
MDGLFHLVTTFGKDYSSNPDAADYRLPFTVGGDETNGPDDLYDFRLGIDLEDSTTPVIGLDVYARTAFGTYRKLQSVRFENISGELCVFDEKRSNSALKPAEAHMMGHIILGAWEKMVQDNTLNSPAEPTPSAR